jgi:TIR domain
MPYVPGFEYDLFVSYASADNTKCGIVELAGAIEKQISDNLVNCHSPQEKVKVYLDRERLATKTCVNWEENLQGAASSSAILVALLSPNYLSSAYCDKEREWFSAQAHAQSQFPFTVVNWLETGSIPLPSELRKAQRHPDNRVSMGAMATAERGKSTRELALKLREALVEMRGRVSAVFLGPAAGRGLETRQRLRDELERSGYRVVPDANYEYHDADEARGLMEASLVAIHFPGGGLELDGLTILEESFLYSGKTLLVEPFGSVLDGEEAAVLEEINAGLAPGGRFAGKAYTHLSEKTDEQVWEAVKREVRAARFRKNPKEFGVGIACEWRDLAGAKEVAGLIGQLGVKAQYPAFDTSASITERLRALQNIITQSSALLCYWADAEGKGLEKRLEQDERRRYQAKAWYLVPPLDMPGKVRLRQTQGMVLQQKGAEADPATLEPFLRELGWEPQA